MKDREIQSIYESLKPEDQGAWDIEMNQEATRLFDKKYGEYDIDQLGEEYFRVCINFLRNELQPQLHDER